ncbi:MAG TPA: glycosyltransferase family 4 protein [Casimicrobiaceae bacterium]
MTLRLAVIRQRYTPFGGAERFLDLALEALAQRGVAVTVYARAWPKPDRYPLDVCIVDPFHVGGLWRDASFARAACRAVRDLGGALVQSHERLSCCDIFRAGDGVHATWLEERSRHLARWRRVALRVSPHHRWRLAMERSLFASPRLKAVICNSRMVKDDIRARFGVDDAKLHVIYNAVASERFTPDLASQRGTVRAANAIAADATLFLHVGSGFERKGLATTLAALAMLPPSVHLAVIGSDRRLARYAARAGSLGIADRVTFAGAVTDPRPWYGAADAFVLPTLYDPFPNAALEAMASGLPIATSTRSGAAELALDFDAGYASAPGDAAALAANLTLLLDPSRRSAMGANARRAVLPLTAEAMSAKLVTLYASLLDRGEPDIMVGR